MIIEFAGTPATGKTTTIDYCNTQLATARLESAHFDFVQDRHLATKIIFSVLDSIMKIQDRDRILSETGVDALLIERGLFDRIVWARLLAYMYPEYATQARDLEEILIAEIEQTPIAMIVLQIASFSTIAERRPRYAKREHNIVNAGNIAFMNVEYCKLYEQYKDRLNIMFSADHRNLQHAVCEKLRETLQ